jgi:hypothetical protein
MAAGGVMPGIAAAGEFAAAGFSGPNNPGDAVLV